MANFGTTQRIVPTSTTTIPTPTAENNEPKGPHEKHLKISCPFNIPSTSEAAAVRIIKNLGNFALYYLHFVWIILFITLIPRWDKTPLILYVIMTYVTCLYCLLLRTWPTSVVLHMIIDKRFVFVLLAIATAAMLIWNGAGINLAVVLATSVPVILVHAVLWVGLDAFELEDGSASSAELATLVDSHNESGDALNA